MKKVVVIGPESTGKSTLSEQLAQHYNTVWVPEFARGYLETLGREYEQQDLLHIAAGQINSEDALGEKANNVLICDTDLQVIRVWSEAKYGDCAAEILQMIAAREYDLYLLTYIDIDWVDDPLREHPHPEERQHFYEVYRDIVVNSGLPWADIRGSYEERLQLAVNAVDRVIGRTV